MGNAEREKGRMTKVKPASDDRMCSNAVHSCSASDGVTGMGWAEEGEKFAGCTRAYAINARTEAKRRANKIRCRKYRDMMDGFETVRSHTQRRQ